MLHSVVTVALTVSSDYNNGHPSYIWPRASVEYTVTCKQEESSWLRWKIAPPPGREFCYKWKITQENFILC